MNDLSIVKKFQEGRADGLENKPKRKNLKGSLKIAYTNGYAEGTKYRSMAGARRFAKT